jgi:hypothetical protein
MGERTNLASETLLVAEEKNHSFFSIALKKMSAR